MKCKKCDMCGREEPGVDLKYFIDEVKRGLSV